MSQKLLFGGKLTLKNNAEELPTSFVYNSLNSLDKSLTFFENLGLG